MKVPQMLHQMISPCKSFFSNAIAAAHRAGEVRGRGAMYGGLVALQVSQACEVGGAGAGGEVACPCPGRRLKKGGGTEYGCGTGAYLARPPLLELSPKPLTLPLISP